MMLDDNKVLAVMLERNQEMKITGNVKTALIPKQEYSDYEEQMQQAKSNLRRVRAETQALTTEGQFRKITAQCDDCNLCMVCAGNHRLYKSWPPGEGECFAFRQKSGSPIRDKPCEFCKKHDKAFRDLKRTRRQNLSASSEANTEINRLRSIRDGLFQTYAVNSTLVGD